MVASQVSKYLVLFALLGLVGCSKDDGAIERQQIFEHVWNDEFEPFERLAFKAEQIVMDESCTFVTVKTEEGEFRAELPVVIKDQAECFGIWKDHSMNWDNKLKRHEGYSENTFYLTRLEDPNRPDTIIVDITSGGASIQALLIGTWITNGYAVPIIPTPAGTSYGESLLHAMAYSDHGIWKDSPKPKFDERDLVVSESEPGTVFQVIDKNFAQDGKNIYGNAVDRDIRENGWYYYCMVLIGENNGQRFRYIPESKLLKTKE